jgi:histone H3/H4
MSVVHSLDGADREQRCLILEIHIANIERLCKYIIIFASRDASEAIQPSVSLVGYTHNLKKSKPG